jgi:hypothetical protein
MKHRNLFAVVGCAAFLAVSAGCTPEARQDVSQAGSNLNDAAVKSAQGTEQAAAKAGEAVSTGAKEAVQGTERAADKAGQAVETGVAKTGQAVEVGTAKAEQSTEKAAADAGKAVKNGAAVVSLTPKVRNAIIADDKVGTKIPDLNVDTKADTKEVVVMGTAPSAAVKDAAIADAKKALADAKSEYKLVDQMKVGAAK